MAELTDTMELTPKELNRSIRAMICEGIMNAEPEAMLAWMSEVQPGQIPRAVLEWAETDLTGATGWLGAREPSPSRDQAIAKFAGEASKLDREAAAAWAREIQDQKLREETLRRIPEN